MGFFKGIFSSKANSKQMQTQDITEREKLVQQLNKVILGKGIHTEFAGYVLSLPELEMSIDAWIENKTQHPNAVVLQLDFVIRQKQFGEEIFEALAGLGETMEVAIQNGVSSFVEGVLDTVIASLDERHNLEMDFETNLEGNTHFWHPKAGVLQVQGNNDLNNHAISGIFNIIRDDIKAAMGNKRFYWIKAYAARQANGEVIAQCILNNETVNAAEEKLKDYAKSWNCGDSFRGEKQYIIIRQCDKTWKPGKYSREFLCKMIDETLDLMERCSTQRDYEKLFDKINSLTKDLDLAFELYCLIPEICCRVVLPQVQYSDEVIVLMPDGAKKERRLMQFEIYSHIKKAIQARRYNGSKNDKTGNIIVLSSGFAAINDAVMQGSKLENLMGGPVTMTAPPDYRTFR